MAIFLAFVLYVAFITIFGAALLRTGISLANRFLPRSEPVTMNVDGQLQVSVSEELAERDLSNPFSPPSTNGELQLHSVGMPAIPMPNFPRACSITLLQIVVSIVCTVAIGVTLSTVGLADPLWTRFLSLVVFALVSPVILGWMAPTSFPRALVVSLAQIVVLATTFLAIASVIVVFTPFFA